MNRLRALVWLLRIIGAMGLLALPMVFLPVSWMAAAHEWLGMGEYPERPIVDYLARSLSLFYALVSLLLIVMASDVERFRPMIRYAGWGSAVAGVLMTGIGLHSGIPTYWSYHEGPSAFVFGMVLLWLLRSVPESGAFHGESWSRVSRETSSHRRSPASDRRRRP